MLLKKENAELCYNKYTFSFVNTRVQINVFTFQMPSVLNIYLTLCSHVKQRRFVTADEDVLICVTALMKLNLHHSFALNLFDSVCFWGNPQGD